MTIAPVTCPGCGASVEYRPGAGPATLVCASCGLGQPIAPVAAAAKDDYAALLAAAVEPDDVARVMTCRNCGARTTVPATVLSERCPFCAAPSVSTGDDRLRRPDAVLPFALDQDQARAAMVAWERALWFRPARLGPAGGAWQLTAVYLPYWSFDWDVVTDYEGARGRRRDNDTAWTAVSGTVRTQLEGSTVFGSRGVGREKGSELEPWDTEHVVGFQDRYLQGVRAETSGLGVAAAGELGHRLLERQVVYEIESDIGGDDQRIDRKTMRYDAVAVRLVLMPVWVTHFEYGGAPHQVLVNARSGEVIGDRPKSRPRMLAPALAPVVLALIGAALLPALVGWHMRETWRAHLASFWLVLGGIGLVGLVGGSLMLRRARRREPARHRDLFVARKGPGATTLQLDPASMWRGVLQADGVARGTLVQISGFALVFVSLAPAFTTVLFTGMLAPVIASHAFSVVAAGVFSWTVRKATRERRKLLGLDDEGRRSSSH